MLSAARIPPTLYMALLVELRAAPYEYVGKQVRQRTLRAFHPQVGGSVALHGVHLRVHLLLVYEQGGVGFLHLWVGTVVVARVDEYACALH